MLQQGSETARTLSSIFFAYWYLRVLFICSTVEALTQPDGSFGVRESTTFCLASTGHTGYVYCQGRASHQRAVIHTLALNCILRGLLQVTQKQCPRLLMHDARHNMHAVVHTYVLPPLVFQKSKALDDNLTASDNVIVSMFSLAYCVRHALGTRY